MIQSIRYILLAGFIVVTSSLAAAAQNQSAEIVSPKLKEIIQFAKNPTVSDSQLKDFSEKTSQQPTAKLLNELESQLLNDNLDLDTRWMAAMIMARIGGQAATERFLKAMQSPVFYVRLAAIKGLEVVAFQQPGVPLPATHLTTLHDALNDKAWVVRAAAADTLGKLGNRESLAHLLKELNQDRNFYRGKSLWVREHIIEAIGAIGGSESIPALIECLKEEDNAITQAALKALNPLQHETLTEFNSSKNWLSWWKAQMAPATNVEPASEPQK